MERNVRKRSPFITLVAVVVAMLATVILASPDAGEFSAGGSGGMAVGGTTVAPCVPVEAPAAAPDGVAPASEVDPGWATEEKLGRW